LRWVVRIDVRSVVVAAAICAHPATTNATTDAAIE
jgi:hypothetical protein